MKRLCENDQNIQETYNSYIEDNKKTINNHADQIQFLKAGLFLYVVCIAILFSITLS